MLVFFSTVLQSKSEFVKYFYKSLETEAKKTLATTKPAKTLVEINLSEIVSISVETILIFSVCTLLATSWYSLVHTEIKAFNLKRMKTVWKSVSKLFRGVFGRLIMFN